MTKQEPATFNAPAVAFDATPTRHPATGRFVPAAVDPPTADGRMSAARRRALLGHTAAGRAILAAEDARNDARAVARRQGAPAPGMSGG
jgi:hypothetical protein